MTTICNYPGRAALIGEHCDWAGGASLAVPLPLSITVTAKPAQHGVRCRSEFEGNVLEGRWPVGGDLGQEDDPLRFVPAAALALAEIGITIPPTQLEVRSTLPSGRGFSSSAAFSLAVIDALSRQAGESMSIEELADVAYYVERELLGVECGRLDQLACAWKRPLFMRWKDGQPVETKPLQPGGTFYLVVAAFATPRDTVGILRVLNRQFFAADDGVISQAVKRTLTQWGAIAESATQSILNGDAPGLGDAMNEVQQSYESNLAANLPELQSPLTSATCAELCNSFAAIGAKFSGAGGDGSIVALFQNDDDATRAFAHLNSRPGVTAWRADF